MQQRRIGAHLSVAKGLILAGKEMMTKGGNALQIFSGSPRGWARKPIEQEKVDAYKAFCKEHDFGPTVIHALYLVNLTADRNELVENSMKAISYDLTYASQLSAVGVVVHLGSHLGRGFDAVFDQLIKNIKRILDATPKDSTFLVENSAGQDGKLCSRFEDIDRVFKALPEYVKQGRLGWCFDTCHGHANGYDITHNDEEMKKYGLLDTLKVIHLNDSRDPFASGRDRHENIGKGEIGVEKLKKFLHLSSFTHIPLILEVPGFDGMGPDAQNVEMVKSLL
jgi:deoxyribonuclease-4